MGILQIFGGNGTGIGKHWYRKSLGTVFGKIGTEKKYQYGKYLVPEKKYRYRLKFWVPSHSDLVVGQVIPTI